MGWTQFLRRHWDVLAATDFFTLTHYHRERSHQGLDNRRIAPEREVGCQTGHVVRRERLGGLLNYYHREAA